MSGAGTQTENKGFLQSTCLCSVYSADEMQTTGYWKLKGIGVSLESVWYAYFFDLDCIFE